MLLILMVIGSPFIIGGLLLFILIYLIIFPFEYPCYYYSKYGKEVKEKYYIFITFSKSYKKYQNLRKGMNKVMIEGNLSFKDNSKTLIIIKNFKDKDQLEMLSKSNQNIYYIINVKNLEKALLSEIESKYNIISYKD